MLTIATVQSGNYLGRGAEYVAKLHDGVRAHLRAEARHVCLTDGSAALPDYVAPIALPPGLVGWWNKLALFRAGTFAHGERVLYLDLDVIPIGALDAIAGYDGTFAGMSDPFWPEHLNSSVMAWEAGTADHIWEAFERSERPMFDLRGDQRLIEFFTPQALRLQALFPGQIASFKADCLLRGRPPEGARLVVFHGHPRPHECRAEWARSAWTKTPLESAA